MRVLLAFDKFKDAVSAGEACDVAQRALRGVRPEWTIDCCPLTDGGEGFEEILANAVGAQRVEVKVAGPRGGFVDAGFALAPVSRFPVEVSGPWLSALPVAPSSPVAIFEMARASGLSGVPLPLRNPWETSSYGTGQLIRAATELGAKLILLGVGGSATNDVGVGALSALGLEFHGETGERFRLAPPREWTKIVRLDGELFPTIPPILVATDVTNPLLGPRGATRLYGPQKGLSPDTTEPLERGVARMAAMLCNHHHCSPALTERPGAGAAGGIAFGLLCAGKAQLVPGYKLAAECIGLAERIARADVVVTGEGRFDATSLEGKGPGAVLATAVHQGKRAHVFAGQITAMIDGVSLHSLTADGPIDRSVLNDTKSRLAAAIQREFRDDSCPDLTERNSRPGAEPGKPSAV